MGLDVQVAFVYTGKRIAQVSPYYNLDYWMLGYGTLDVSFEQRITKHFGFYGKVNNLTNAAAKTVICSHHNQTANCPTRHTTIKLWLVKTFIKSTYWQGSGINSKHITTIKNETTIFLHLNNYLQRYYFY